MQKRIDFSMIDKPEKETAGSVVIPEGLTFAMSDSKKLKHLIDQLDAGCCAFWVSNGDWSMHQLLMALLDKTGPAKVYMSTYAMSETAARIVAQLKDQQIITELHCLLDDRVDVRSAGSLQLIQSVANKYALVHTHAKVTAIINDNWHVSVVGSANYTENKRFESGVVICDKGVTEQQQYWITNAMNDAV